MAVFAFVGLFDIVAAVVFWLGGHGIGTVLPFILGLALFLKGVSLLTKLPIWFGPLGFFGGLIDLIIGVIMYFGAYTGPQLSHIALVLSAFLILKGMVTSVFGLATGGTPY